MYILFLKPIFFTIKFFHDHIQWHIPKSYLVQTKQDLGMYKVCVYDPDSLDRDYGETHNSKIFKELTMNFMFKIFMKLLFEYHISIF